MSKKRKEKLFQLGVSAAERVLGTHELYFCPLCGNSFDYASLIQGELTLEHVPPKSHGGKGIILTCQSCNNKAGHTIDSAAHRRKELTDFIRTVYHKQEGEAGLATFEADGRKINVLVSNDGGTTNIKILDKNNDPEAVGYLQEYMKSLADSGNAVGTQFSITARVRYHKRFSEISDLRSAFLVCSAQFGYSYSFSRALMKVRGQILNPNQEILEKWYVKIKTQTDSPMLAVAEKEGIVIVSVAERSVVLPWIGKSDTAFESTSAAIDDTNNFTVRAVPVDWPKGFVAALDRRCSLRAAAGRFSAAAPNRQVSASVKRQASCDDDS